MPTIPSVPKKNQHLFPATFFLFFLSPREMEFLWFVIGFVLFFGLFLWMYPQLKLPSNEPVVPMKKKKRKFGRGERRCRQLFEHIFQRPFPKARPHFLRNPVTGQNLELDGFCRPLQLAFEYNGKQHYDYTPFFHKSEHDVLYQMQKDIYKEEECRKRGIRLISIPYTVPLDQLGKYIVSELRRTRVLD